MAAHMNHTHGHNAIFDDFVKFALDTVVAAYCRVLANVPLQCTVCLSQLRELSKPLLRKYSSHVDCTIRLQAHLSRVAKPFLSTYPVCG